MPASARPALIAALLACLLAVPAAADGDIDADCYVRDEVEYCERSVWFTPAETKVGNLAATGATAFPTWDEEEPTASVTAGAGGGYAANGTFRQTEGNSDPTFMATFVGAHEGRIDNLDVTLYLFAPGRQNETTFSASADLLVDGARVMSFDQADLPLAPAGDAVLSTAFAVTDVEAALLRKGIDPQATHEITVAVTGYAIATTSAVFVYDTTEVPAGMVFNAPVLREGVPTFRAR